MDGLSRPETSSYSGYDRSHEIYAAGKAKIDGSSDPSFRGDAARWNPEELLMASLSACHQLCYLHLCAAAEIAVVAYEDQAVGTMEELSDGAGQLSEIILRPYVLIACDSDAEKARDLHADASRMCFIERSLKCPVRHDPTILIAEDPIVADPMERPDDSRSENNLV